MKLFGLILIFLCSSLCGAYSSYKTNMALKQLRGIINFMRYIKNQIEYFNAPIDSIYESFDAESEQFKSFLCNVSMIGWKKTLEGNNELYFPDNVSEILKQFGATLGKSGKDEQLSLCEYYIGLLESEYKKMESDAPQKMKITMALGVSAGIMLVILFI